MGLAVKRGTVLITVKASCKECGHQKEWELDPFEFSAKYFFETASDIGWDIPEGCEGAEALCPKHSGWDE